MPTKIPWTDETWNPVVGCTKVSAGCEHCYAARLAKRLAYMASSDIDAGRNPGGKSKYLHVLMNKPGVCYYPEWNGNIEVDEDAMTKPLHWRKPRRIFVCSMGDLFHRNVRFETIDRVFAVMALCPQHTFQILTKRAERMAEYFTTRPPYDWRMPIQSMSDNVFQIQRTAAAMIEDGDGFGINDWPLPNAWLGVTAENQETADERIPILMKIPAAVRFVSHEPSLGAVDLTLPANNGSSDMGSIDWVICGGESGPGARPMHPDSARSLRDQCDAAGVPFFFKQHGEWICSPVIDDPQMSGGRSFAHYLYGGRSAAMIRERSTRAFTSGNWRPLRKGDRTDKTWMLDDDTIAIRVGKKAAGRLLDGKLHDAFPKVKR